jgi:DNA end-binding protein Ku
MGSSLPANASGVAPGANASHMRSTWKGSISFGLVNIPIAVYPATREEKISFKQLRKGDLSPIRYKKVAETDEKEVRSEEIVKGYEYEKGKWVTLTDEDFAKVEIASTHTIEITDFVELSEINPKFFYKPYFLEAQKGGEKGYALLHRALSESGKVGIAKVTIHSREYLASVKPDGLFLILDLMHFSHEVLEPEGLKVVTGIELAPKEVQMAQMLVESMSGEWNPETYEGPVPGSRPRRDRPQNQTRARRAENSAEGAAGDARHRGDPAEEPGSIGEFRKAQHKTARDGAAHHSRTGDAKSVASRSAKPLQARFERETTAAPAPRRGGCGVGVGAALSGIGVGSAEPLSARQPPRKRFIKSSNFFCCFGSRIARNSLLDSSMTTSVSCWLR